MLLGGHTLAKMGSLGNWYDFTPPPEDSTSYLKQLHRELQEFSSSRVMDLREDNISNFHLISVKSYGAIGDGVHDDTKAIQGAIDDSPIGSCIYFPAGIYLVTGGIVMKHYRTYQGAGMAGTEIKLKDSSNPDYILTSEAYANNTTNKYLFTIKDLVINGNHDNNSSGHAIQGNFMFSYFENLYIYDSPEDAIRLEALSSNSTDIGNCLSNKILYCRLLDYKGNGIYAETGGKVTDCWVVGCPINTDETSASQRGIYVANGGGWFILDNHLDGISQDGIYVNTAYQTTIRNNLIANFGGDSDNSTYYGIYLGALNSEGSAFCHDNTVVTERDVSGSTYVYIGFAGNSTTKQGAVFIHDNYVANIGDTSVATHIGIRQTAQGDDKEKLRGFVHNNCISPTGMDTTISYPTASLRPDLGWWGNSDSADGGFNFQAQTVASASTITLPPGNVFWITGTTGITSITASDEGRMVTLKFASNPTVTDGSNLKLAGNFSPNADSTLTLVCDGTNWYEVARSTNS